MQISDLGEETLRRLAEAGGEGATVVSLYLDLDPSEFATPAARSTAIRSLLDDAGRQEAAVEDLSHDERTHLREDVDRVRTLLEDDEVDFKGTHGLAVFCSGGHGLLDVLHLPRSVPSEVRIGPKPHIGPLVDMVARGDWCVIVVSRRVGRLMRGSADRLVEVGSISDDPTTHHEGGGRQQSREQRGQTKVDDDHFKRVADLLLRSFKRAPFDRLLIATNSELLPGVAQALHPYVKERLAGHIDVDEEQASPEDVLEAARPAIEADERDRERQALDRLAEGVGTGGRGAAGLGDVLEALYERRVETLLVADGFAATGVRCPKCGWLGVEGIERCPADDTPVDHVENVLAPGLELAVTQAAAVLVPRHFDDLDGHQGIAAVLRF